MPTPRTEGHLPNSAAATPYRRLWQNDQRAVRGWYSAEQATITSIESSRAAAWIAAWRSGRAATPSHRLRHRRYWPRRRQEELGCRRPVQTHADWRELHAPNSVRAKLRGAQRTLRSGQPTLRIRGHDPRLLRRGRLVPWPAMRRCRSPTTSPARVLQEDRDGAVIPPMDEVGPEFQHLGRRRMTPTLIGRIQTRIALLLFFGVPWTIVVTVSSGMTPLRVMHRTSG